MFAHSFCAWKRRGGRHGTSLRQITRRVTVMIPVLGRKQVGYRRSKAPNPGAFLERYRSNLAAITAERQPEIDALSHKLARQDQAIARIRAKYRHLLELSKAA